MQKCPYCYFHCFHCSGIYLGRVRVGLREELLFHISYLKVTPENALQQFSGVCLFQLTPQAVFLNMKG